MQRKARVTPAIGSALLILALLLETSAWPGTAGTETYTYDALGRMRTIAFPDGTKSTYDYDAAGNRLAVNTGTDNVAPSAPSALVATAALSTTVNLRWSAASDTGGSGLAGYDVYRNGSTSVLGSSTGTTYSDTTTSGTITYTYIVKARDGAGSLSAASNTASVTTPDTIAPTVPTGLTATTVNAGQINLSWAASTDSGGSGLKGYKITRNGVALTPTITTATTFADTGLTVATSYTYTVAAYDVVGNTSSASAAASATTLSSYVDAGTMGVAVINQSPSSVQGRSFVGFALAGAGAPAAMGSYAPAPLLGGKSLAAFYETISCTISGAPPQPIYCVPANLALPGTMVTVAVNGFTADPGAAWLTSVAAIGKTRTGATATYSFSAGTATWRWAGPPNLFWFGLGSTTTTIVHK